LLTDSEVGLTEADANRFAVYPNPAVGGQTSLVYDQRSPMAVARIFDMGGREVASQTMQGEGFQQRTLDLGTLRAGMYLLRLEDGSAVSTARLIVQ